MNKDQRDPFDRSHALNYLVLMSAPLSNQALTFVSAQIKNSLCAWLQPKFALEKAKKRVILLYIQDRLEREALTAPSLHK